MRSCKSGFQHAVVVDEDNLNSFHCGRCNMALDSASLARLRYEEDYRDFIETWGRNCGAPRSVFEGHLGKLISLHRAAVEEEFRARNSAGSECRPSKSEAAGSSPAGPAKSERDLAMVRRSALREAVGRLLFDCFVPEWSIKEILGKIDEHLRKEVIVSHVGRLPAVE